MRDRTLSRSGVLKLVAFYRSAASAHSLSKYFDDAVRYEEIARRIEWMTLQKWRREADEAVSE